MKGIKRAIRSVALGVISCACAVSFSACDVVDTVKGAVSDTYETVKNTVLGWFGIEVEQEVVLYTYTVTFETNGGTAIAPAIYQTNTTYKPEKPADPVKQGYDFGGWYLDQAYTNAYDFETDFNSDVTLYALFTGNPYTVTFETNGAGEIPSQFLAEYQTPTRPEDPVLEDYHFIGWYLDDESTVRYDFDYVLEEDTTLYAYFSDSILISTTEDLVNIAKDPTADYILTDDINLSGSIWTPLENFSGTLDGNGHTIRFFAMARTTILSGFILTNDGVLKDLTIKDIAFASTCTSEYVSGTLVGENNGRIENCRVEGLVASFKSKQMSSGGTYFSYVGGLVGRNNETGVVKNCSVQGALETAVIANNLNTNDPQWSYSNTQNTLFVGGVVCENYGDVEGVTADLTISHLSETVINKAGQGATVYAYVGGLVGVNYKTVRNSLFAGELLFSTKGDGVKNTYVGGFVGQNFPEAVVVECGATGEIVEEGGNTTALSVGGFAYLNAGGINNSYTQMNVTTTSAGQATDLIGGFVALNKYTVSTSYESGNVQTASVGKIGGFVASHLGGVIISCISSGDFALATAENFKPFAFESDTILSWCVYESDAEITVNGEAYEYAGSETSVEGISSELLYTEDVVYRKESWSSSVWTLESGLPTFVWEN